MRQCPAAVSKTAKLSKLAAESPRALDTLEHSASLLSPCSLSLQSDRETGSLALVFQRAGWLQTAESPADKGETSLREETRRRIALIS